MNKTFKYPNISLFHIYNKERDAFLKKFIVYFDDILNFLLKNRMNSEKNNSKSFTYF